LAGVATLTGSTTNPVVSSSGGNVYVASCGYYMCFGPLNSSWSHFNTNAGGFYFYCPICTPTYISAPCFCGPATSAATATCAGCAGVFCGCACCAYCACCSGCSATLNGLTKSQIFNNSGCNHSTWTCFAGPTDFGPQFVHQDAAYNDGPTCGSPGGSNTVQYYASACGLGNDYAYSSYVFQEAIARNVTTPYHWVRSREGGTWQSWTKISAGYADTANCASLSGYASNLCTGTNINGANICATSCFCGPYYNASGYFYGPTVYATSCLCSCGVLQALSDGRFNGCVCAAEICTSGWLRTSGGCTGLYSSNFAMHFYPCSTNNWTIAPGGAGLYPSLRFVRDSHQGTTVGYLYSDSGGFGLLTCSGGWTFRNAHGGGITMYQCTCFEASNVYIQCCLNTTGCICSSSCIMSPILCASNCLTGPGTVAVCESANGYFANRAYVIFSGAVAGGCIYCTACFSTYVVQASGCYFLCFSNPFSGMSSTVVTAFTPGVIATAQPAYGCKMLVKLYGVDCSYYDDRVYVIVTK
jgi:hypothetical protein